MKAFGHTARKLYRNLEDEERLQCAFFEQIKMDLQQDEVCMVQCAAYNYSSNGIPSKKAEKFHFYERKYVGL